MSLESTSLAFACNVPTASPRTPGLVTSTDFTRYHALPVTDPRYIRSLKRLTRDFETMDIRFPDGRSLEFWVFTDEGGTPVYPSKLIRVTEGDVAQVTIKTSKGPHTIHHHGIEPDAFNDGVGHTSFEADDYIYQWKAHHPGTYIYHCHVNTTLHVQMGLVGVLIIDPDPALDRSPPPTGYRRLFPGGPIYPIANERIWAVSAIDPRWHNLGHDAGLCGEDVGLHNFNPKYFMINNQTQVNGAIGPGLPPPPGPITDPTIAVTTTPGQTILFRVVNAQYHLARIAFGGDTPSGPAPISAQIWGSDGRPFRQTWDYKGENETGNPVRVDLGPAEPFRMSPAERWDFLVNTPDAPLQPRADPYPISVLITHWITNAPIGIVLSQIKINPA